MTRLWRLAPARHDPLSGEGARRYGGRWTSPGRPAVYLASQLPLAVLEVLAHVDRDTLPLDLTAFAVDVPDALGAPADWGHWDERALPDGWRAVAQPAAGRAVGDGWLTTPAAERAALLRVPTAVLPDWAESAGAGLDAGSWCAVLDPTHPDAARVTVAARHPFAFDRRLVARRA
jgi:RES domain-containing protein